MRKIEIYGASDDLIEFEGTLTEDGEPDEIEFFGDNRTAYFVVEDKSDEKNLKPAIAFSAHFGYKGCWYLGLAPEDHGRPVLDCCPRFSFRGHSAELHLEIPDEYRIKQRSYEQEE